MKFGTVSAGRYAGADRYTGVAVGRRSTVITPMKAMHLELEAANKSDMRVQGMCNLELSVHGLIINIDAVVVDLNCHAILGMDILGDASKLPFILDLVKGTLSGGGYETIQLHRFQAATECFAETSDSVCIPPHSEVMLWAKLKTNNGRKGPTSGVVLALQTFVQEFGLLVGRSLVRSDADDWKIPILIYNSDPCTMKPANCTCNPVIIPAHTRIARVDEIQAIQHISSRETEMNAEEGALPPHLIDVLDAATELTSNQRARAAALLAKHVNTFPAPGTPITGRTEAVMHHLPHIFFDTLRPERPDCPVLVPSSFTRSRDRVINMDIYSYEPCGLPTGNFMPAEKAQIHLMTASPITLRACIPAPDQVTSERAYFKDLDFYKKTLFHTPFLSRGRAVTLLEYRDAKIVFEVDDWFSQLPQGVQRYLLPLQSMYAKWYAENVRDLTQNYSYCPLCKTKQSNLQRHHMQHHARWRTIWFCPIPGCPSSLSTKDGLVKHLMSKPHARGVEVNLGRKVAKQIANQNCYWPITQVMADKLLVASKRLIRYIALYSMAGVAMENRLFRIHPNARDTPFMEACAAFLTPKMSLSQVMPSGCHLRRVAQPPTNLPAVAD